MSQLFTCTMCMKKDKPKNFVHGFEEVTSGDNPSEVFRVEAEMCTHCVDLCKSDDEFSKFVNVEFEFNEYYNEEFFIIKNKN